MFEALVAAGIQGFDYRIHGYCWMGNHAHLALQVGKILLSKIMQNLSFRYSRQVNRRERRVGHLFQGGYKATLVDADAHLLELIQYIHLNPVRAGLVAAQEDYCWSGHREYLGRRRVSWLTTEWVL